MKRTSKIFLMSMIVSLVACMTSRIIKQTDTTAVIQGVGPTEFEAKEHATQKARDIFENVKETKEAECNQEMQGGGHTTGKGVNQTYSASTQTYYSCVMYFEKSR